MNAQTTTREDAMTTTAALIARLERVPTRRDIDDAVALLRGMGESQPQPSSEDARDDGCLCVGCLWRYRVDLMVPDDLWAEINPGGGLLCGRCIMDRTEARGQFDAFNASPVQPSTEEPVGGPDPRELERWAEWYDSPSRSSRVVVPMPSGASACSAGYLLRAIASEHRKAALYAPPSTGEDHG